MKLKQLKKAKLLELSQDMLDAILVAEGKLSLVRDGFDKKEENIETAYRWINQSMHNVFEALK